MPARDGTGPLGQGSRSGRGMGNCKPNRRSATQPAPPMGSTYRSGWFGRMWDNTFGKAWGRGWRNRMFWK